MSAQQNTEQQTTVGAYLRRLRSEKNISVAEVGARMYLHTNTIEALERDDHEALPDPLYVYGYLNHYAKILDVAADELVAMYKQDTTQPREQVAKTYTQAAPKTKQPAKWLHVIMYLGIFMLILALFTLWRGRHTQEQIENTNRQPTPPATIVEHSDTSSSPALNAETAETEPTTAPETMLQTETSREPEATNTTEPEADNAGDSDSAPDPVTEPQTATSGSEPDTAPALETTTISAGSGPDTLRLVVTIDCWIEVFDVNNEKVYYDLAHAGQILVLNGAAPLSVLLGNADAATVEFNNTPFDFTPYVTRIGIARFTLGEAE